jgi:hypothetical protein
MNADKRRCIRRNCHDAFHDKQIPQRHYLRSSAFICGFIIVAAERRRENASGDPPTLYAGRNRRKKLNHDGTKHTKNESAIKPSS